MRVSDFLTLVQYKNGWKSLLSPLMIRNLPLGSTRSLLLAESFTNNWIINFSNACELKAAQCRDSTIKLSYNRKCREDEDGDGGSSDGECGQTVYTGSQGTIQHGNYPYNYRPNMDCVYVIRAPDNNRIVFYFQMFQVRYLSKFW